MSENQEYISSSQGQDIISVPLLWWEAYAYYIMMYSGFKNIFRFLKGSVSEGFGNFLFDPDTN